MDELTNISPRFPKNKKVTSFKVPDDYFENFPQRLQEKIYAENKSIPKERRLQILKPYLAAAVLVIVAVISGSLIFRGLSDKNTISDLQVEISQVVEWELYSISEETILEVMNDRNIEEEYAARDNSEEIIEYLMNEDIPIEDLIDAL